MNSPEQRILAALREAEALIAYTPIGDEPEFSVFLEEEGIKAGIIRLPPKRERDPVESGRGLSALYAGERVCVLVPGRVFDRSGTRHGRGGGWYDRFLSSVPREWLRVGVLDASQLSREKLKRESWDEPMDALLVRDRSGWKVVNAETP